MKAIFLGRFRFHDRPGRGRRRMFRLMRDDGNREMNTRELQAGLRRLNHKLRALWGGNHGPTN